MSQQPGSGSSMRRWLVPFVVVVVAAIVGSVAVVLVTGDDDTAAVAIVLEPVNTTGTDPFTASVAIRETSDLPDSVTATNAGLDPDTTTGGRTTPGNAPGLYGGTQDETVCDPDQLVTFLDQNPSKAAAWANVLGISTDNIKTYVAGLTPVVLTTDTRVTNHGYKNGEATTFQSVLQAGTAVLVDDRGVPRVKCGCGNPLTEPNGTTAAPTANPWPGYQPDHVTIITPAPQPITNIVLIDITTGDTYQETITTGSGSGNGEWIAVAGTGQSERTELTELHASDDDGKTWSAIGKTEQSENTWINAVAYGEGTWVAVGGLEESDDFQGVVFVSEDARSWRQVATAHLELNSVAYGDGMWTAVGGSNTAGWFFTSPDGTRWTESAEVEPPTTTGYFIPNEIAFGNGTWTALAYEVTPCAPTQGCERSTLLTSPDAVNWTITESHFLTGASIAYGAGQWLVAASEFGAQAPVLSTSRDLTSWSPVTTNVALSPGRSPVIAFGRGTWLLAGVYGDAQTSLLSSADGRRWTPSGNLEGAGSLARGGYQVSTPNRAGTTSGSPPCTRQALQAAFSDTPEDDLNIAILNSYDPPICADGWAAVHYANQGSYPLVVFRASGSSWVKYSSADYPRDPPPSLDALEGHVDQWRSLCTAPGFPDELHRYACPNS